MNGTKEQTVVGKDTRKRKKRLLNQIRNQVEFYFSDANLHRDRFLKKEIDKSPEGYVDVSLLFTFNKLKTLTTDVTLLGKALKKSDLLQLSEDGSQVRRRKPLGEAKDVDERTIYVECLPKGVVHDWVTNVFSPYGKVLYVSLPKYQSTGDPKGFAFVEFDSPEAAQRACEDFDDTVSTGVGKPGRFPKASKQMKSLQKQLSLKSEKPKPQKRNASDVGEDGDVPCKKPHKSSSGTSVDSSNDTRNSEEIEAADYTVISKKLNGNTEPCVEAEPVSLKPTEPVPDKEDHTNKDSKALPSTSPLTSQIRKRKASDASEEPSDIKRVIISDVLQVSKIDETNKAKRKKKKKKIKSKPKELPELRVLPKNKWLELRKEYLDIQKSSMKALKSSLAQYKKTTNHKGPKNETSSQSSVIAADIKPPVKTGIEFVPDVIVHFLCENPTTRKDVKNSIASYADDVAYIDFLDGDKEGFIRCKNKDSAKTLTTITLPAVKMSIIQGDEEKKYWEKLFADRHNKLTSKQKPKKRGSQKIIDRAERLVLDINKKKHTFFTDDD